MVDGLQSTQQVRKIIRICDKTIAKDQVEIEEMAIWANEDGPFPAWERANEFK